MKVIFIIGLYLAFCVWLSRHDRQNDEPEEQTPPPPEVDYWELSRRIEQLHQTDERLRSVEELITDLELCVPEEHEKSVTIEWVTATGDTRRYDLWIDGRANTERMLLVAYAERERLHTSLLLQLDSMKIGARCNDNVNENVIYIDRKGG